MHCGEGVLKRFTGENLWYLEEGTLGRGCTKGVHWGRGCIKGDHWGESVLIESTEERVH